CASNIWTGYYLFDSW
nr:immunoglobulin heavy chain junction region [Macaca mulatta]